MFKIDELLEASGGRLACGGRASFIKGISIDSRSMTPGDAFIAIKGNNFDGHHFIRDAAKKGASCIIYHSGVRIPKQSRASFIKVKDTAAALGGIAAFWRKRFNIPVVAVTGSNGKTTTKDMIAHVLSHKAKVLKNEGTKNNHIGLPMALLGLDRSYDFAVLEAGSNHPGEIEYLARIARANIGVITNIGPSHLEHFGSLKGILKEKTSLLKYLSSPGIAVLNADNEHFSARLTKSHPAFGFGINAKSDFSASQVRAAGKGTEFLVNEKYKFALPVLGRCNVYNALAAIAVARICGLGYRDIALRLESFRAPAGRLNFIEVNGFRFIDDTYNANPLSLAQALLTLDKLQVKGRKILVMGDMLELGAKEKSFHRQAGRDAMDICDVFVAVGRLSGLSGRQAMACNHARKKVFMCGSALEARDVLFKKISLSPEDVVLVKGSRGMKMEQVFRG